MSQKLVHLFLIVFRDWWGFLFHGEGRLLTRSALFVVKSPRRYGVAVSFGGHAVQPATQNLASTSDRCAPTTHRGPQADTPPVLHGPK